LSEKIGFIGLGTMGKPMAMNLLKAGYSLVCYDINREAVKDIVSMGAEEGKSLADTAGKSDIVITMLPADREIIDVYTSENGILNSIRDESICVDMTSARGETIIEAEKFARSIGKKNKFLDAPVSGGVQAARNGTLTIMAGGDKDVLDKCRQILSVMGKKIYHTGPLGSGKSVKMINQYLNAGNTYIMSEALYLAKSMGLDMNTLYGVITESSGDSWVFRNNVPKFILPGEYDAGFRLELMKKDLGLAVEQAHRDNISLPAMNFIYQVYLGMCNRGYGKKNYNIVSKWVENQNKPPEN
jgi:3-hydroxyisobutyrate dehydrogenase-like beta-hydroxyacid dehydrogenase